MSAEIIFPSDIEVYRKFLVPLYRKSGHLILKDGWNSMFQSSVCIAVQRTCLKKETNIHGWRR